MCVAMLTGCAAGPEKPKPVVTTQPVERVYIGEGAAALAFDAPMRAYRPTITIDRQARRPAAFGGYEEMNVTYTDIVIDDNQHLGEFDNYQRRTYSVQSSITYR